MLVARMNKKDLESGQRQEYKLFSSNSFYVFVSYVLNKIVEQQLKEYTVRKIL